ncbi:MAG: hypothetical protein KA974_11050 [Saprospiraceae bacterium]|nr:hypothetical protein [Saprospiraceae bacterium]
MYTQKIIFIFCLTLLNNCLIYTQTVSAVKWGNEFREPSNTFVNKIIGFDNDEMFVLRNRYTNEYESNNKIYIEKFNSELNISKANDINLKFEGKKLNFQEAVLMKGKLYLLSSFHNRSKEISYLFYQQVDKEKLQAERDITKLSEIKTGSYKNAGLFSTKVSKDSSKLAVISQLPSDKNKQEQFSIQVFNDGMQQLWQKNIRLPYNDENLSLEEYIIDNQGNIYITGVLYEDKAKVRRKGKPTYKYVIISYKNEGTIEHVNKIDLGNQFITDMTYRVANDGNLICSGFYSGKGTYSIKGTFYFRLNTASNEISELNTKEFPFDFLTEYLSERNKEKAKNALEAGKTNALPELYQYSLDDLIIRSDGGAVLIAEQYYIEERFDRYNNGFGGFSPYGGYSPWGWGGYNGYNRMEYVYYYNDIIVVNLQPNGDLEWVTRIPKRQSTIDDGGYFLSYAKGVVKDKMYFIFNDNAKNYYKEQQKASDKIYSYTGSNSVVTLATINQNGEVSVEPLYNNNETESTIRPKLCKQIGKKEMLLLSEDGRKIKFGKLIFE